MAENFEKRFTIPAWGWIAIGTTVLVCWDRLMLICCLTIIISLLWQFRKKLYTLVQWTVEAIGKKLNKQ